MNPEEKAMWWQRTVDALKNRDPRVHVAIATALILKHGALTEGKDGQVHVSEKITLEELLNTTKNYAFEVRADSFGVIEVTATSLEDLGHGRQRRS